MKSVQSPKSCGKASSRSAGGDDIVGAPVAALVVPDSADAGTVSAELGANGAGLRCARGSASGTAARRLATAARLYPRAGRGHAWRGKPVTSGLGHRLADRTRRRDHDQLRRRSPARELKSRRQQRPAGGAAARLLGRWQAADGHHGDDRGRVRQSASAAATTASDGLRLASSCNNYGMIKVAEVDADRDREQGPSLIALGGNNLWYQSGTVGPQRHRRWRLADRAAAQAIHPASATCGPLSMATFRGRQRRPNTAVWHQCPDQTWTQGAVVEHARLRQRGRPAQPRARRRQRRRR